MGGAKRQWEAEQDQGYCSHESVTVCSDCIIEYGISEFIVSNSSSSSCSYCGNTTCTACNLDYVIEYVLECVKNEWGHPADEGLPYESREGGWQFANVISTWELMHIVGLDVQIEAIYDDICSSIHNEEWCKKNPYSLTPDRTLMYGWQSFSDFVINTSRYVFYKAKNINYDEHQHDEMNPVDILDALGSIIQKQKLIQKISIDTTINRIRIVDPNVSLITAKELGSPPNQYANIANRMSPAGISMFYGAFDIGTAIKETYEENPETIKKAICGNFQPARELTVIDLSLVSTMPSLFDQRHRDNRNDFRFLIDFIADFSKPINRTDRAHIDYVPTQIVTEYFRHVLLLKDDIRIDGVIYPSSKNEGHQAIVIFADSSQCVDAYEMETDHALLKLKDHTEIDLSAK